MTDLNTYPRFYNYLVQKIRYKEIFAIANGVYHPNTEAQYTDALELSEKLPEFKIYDGVIPTKEVNGVNDAQKAIKEKDAQIEMLKKQVAQLSAESTQAKTEVASIKAVSNNEREELLAEAKDKGIVINGNDLSAS